MSAEKHELICTSGKAQKDVMMFPSKSFISLASEEVDVRQRNQRPLAGMYICARTG